MGCYKVVLNSKKHGSQGVLPGSRDPHAILFVPCFPFFLPYYLLTSSSGSSAARLLRRSAWGWGGRTGKPAAQHVVSPSLGDRPWQCAGSSAGRPWRGVRGWRQCRSSTPDGSATAAQDGLAAASLTERTAAVMKGVQRIQ